MQVSINITKEALFRIVGIAAIVTLFAAPVVFAATTIASNAITLSGTTGQNTLTLTDNVADALSIVGSGDMMVFNTTDASESVTISTAATISGLATLSAAAAVTGNVGVTNGALVYADSGTVDDQCVGDNAVANLSTGNFFTIDMSEGDADCAVTFTNGTTGGIYVLNLISGGAFEFTLGGVSVDSDTFCVNTFGADNDSAFVTVRASSATNVQVLSCALNVNS